MEPITTPMSILVDEVFPQVLTPIEMAAILQSRRIPPSLLRKVWRPDPQGPQPEVFSAMERMRRKWAMAPEAAFQIIGALHYAMLQFADQNKSWLLAKYEV